MSNKKMKTDQVIFSVVLGITIIVLGLLSLFDFRYRYVNDWTLLSVLGYLCIILGIIGFIFIGIRYIIENKDK